MSAIASMMNDFCRVLIDVERNGIKIDLDALNELEREYTEEYKELENRLEILARNSLGDTPFNLSSNDDLSMIIYSRKPICKKTWANIFNLGSEMVNGVRKIKKPRNIDKKELKSLIRDNTRIQFKTKATQCTVCKGGGKTKKLLKSGLYSERPTKCRNCGGVGILYAHTNEIAGFKQLPKSANDLSAHGYKCNKDKLQELARAADGEAKDFLTAMVRFNAVAHYLSSFIKGIRENVGRDGVLHTQFMQCVTATGRLSSRNPNFHNQPRGGTFPIRKVVISRWAEGSITEADYAQLEFRVAASLAKDYTAIADITNGRDVHQYTADILTKNGQPTDRQDAKHHTFKPLYGGTSGTKAEKAYYKQFQDRYNYIRGWHKTLMRLALNYKMLKLPTGRIYRFPWVKQTAHGLISDATKIKNYPVQGFATADIVPMATISLYKLYKQHKLKSVIINEVHDSIVTDTYPGEEEIVANLKIQAMTGVIDELKDKFNYNFLVPLKVEVKNGINWLDMSVTAEGESKQNT